MNERFVFLISIPFAELSSSVVAYVLFPQAFQTHRAPDAVSFTTSHAAGSLGVWLALSLLSLVLMPKLWRRRQNRSSKLTLFKKIGAFALLLDAGTSFFLWLRTGEDGPLDGVLPLPGILIHLALFAVLFALAILVADQIAEWHLRRNPPAMTPPPRFGKR